VKGSLRLRFGIWLAEFKWTHRFIGKYSHEGFDGSKIYLNRISRTFLRRY